MSPPASPSGSVPESLNTGSNSQGTPSIARNTLRVNSPATATESISKKNRSRLAGAGRENDCAFESASPTVVALVFAPGFGFSVRVGDGKLATVDVVKFPTGASGSMAVNSLSRKSFLSEEISRMVPAAIVPIAPVTPTSEPSKTSSSGSVSREMLNDEPAGTKGSEPETKLKITVSPSFKLPNLREVR